MVLANLFGTPERVALAMGRESVGDLREVGKLLAFLKEPEAPQGVRDAFAKLPLLKQALWDPLRRFLCLMENLDYQPGRIFFYVNLTGREKSAR